MYDNYNYPAGADTPSAPWNQSEPEEREFDMLCSQTLSKSINIFSTNYTEEVDEEYDEEGHKCRDVVIGTENIDWREEFHDNGYHTPIQLLALFKTYLEDALNGTKNANYYEHELKHLISECEDWSEDETEYMED